MPLLRQRRRRPEIMDQPDLCPRRHAHALAGLGRINALSRTETTYWGTLCKLQARLGLPRLRILDVACGGGDVARRLWHRADRAGLDWRIAGCDLSPVAVENARAAARKAGTDIHYFTHDILSDAPVSGAWDVVICSLFLHHLDEEQAVAMLSKMMRIGESGPWLVLISDLERGLLAFLLTHVVCRLITTSDVVHTDGPRSVEAAFTPEEALALAGKAGMIGATVRRVWPFRWLLSWSRL